jgi:hypothetical protein
MFITFTGTNAIDFRIVAIKFVLNKKTAQKLIKRLIYISL